MPNCVRVCVVLVSSIFDKYTYTHIYMYIREELIF